MKKENIVYEETKTKETKTYVALFPLPICGIKKDDIIVLNDSDFQVIDTNSGSKKTFEYSNIISINFDDKTFFKKVHNAKYKVDDIVLVHDKGSGKKWYGYITNISKYGLHDVTYDIYTTGCEKLKDVSECKIVEKTVKYWFCNSEGQTCQTLLGKDHSADDWRRTIGNMFETKEEVTAYKTKLREMKA